MIVYDIEIRNCIPPRFDTERLPEYTYCRGWHDYEGMGIACIGVYDYRENRYRVFDESTLSHFAQLIHERDVCIGFNNIAFDNQLLSVQPEFFSSEELHSKSYDILESVRVAAGIPAAFTPGVTRAGYTLDAIAKANGIISKSGNGAFAPMQWQDGYCVSVIDYCLTDVYITTSLMNIIRNTGKITDPTTYGTLDIALPSIFCT